MPATYTLIASNTLSSAAASVTFSSIPVTYTNLVLRALSRGTVSGDRDFLLSINGNTSSISSWTAVFGNGGATGSFRSSNQVNLRMGNSTGSDTLANTFSSIEIYIPNYQSTTSKPIGSHSMSENNIASAVRSDAFAGLFRNTSAITSIAVSNDTGNLAADSSFYLYGISNS